ncbi:hypothetical protein LEP1GSC186_1685 [Leptospira noguchii serovar Autumnalis str. ZUN142]|uniref:Uncharacterized protein n=1 Tax=Leptospira noguchii serovar Autumnalis str. ZUN142 TaxID=1085540 RepID=M6U4H9_9LEPT|nr:hypothetical protein LEP1GSC186_1685 [Leptospira noguchii serovar Autumnalis str. ZUN142]
MKNSEGIGAKSAVVSHFNYEICERFAPIFLRRTQVKFVRVPTDYVS